MPKTVNADDIKQALDDTKDDVFEVNDLPAVTEWCSTGCTLLDLALSGKLEGGIPVGRIIQVYGAASTCKTVLGTTILGAAQRAGKLAFFADVENTFDAKFARMYGLNPDKDFYKAHPRTVEDLFDTYLPSVLEEAKAQKKSAVIVVDSLTAMPSEVEVSNDLSKSTFGTSRAKQIGTGLRKFIYDLAQNKVTLFIIDQTRDNISGYGRKEIVAGGRGLEFYSSCRIYLKGDSKVENANKVVIGFWVNFEITKNKVAIPHREGQFKIAFDYGMDDIESNLFFISMAQNGIAKAEKKLTTINLWGEDKKLSTWVSYVEDNNLESKLREEVANVWTEYHKTESRKPRQWGD